MVVKNTINNVLVACLIVLLSACGGAEERKAKYMEKGKNYFSEKNYDKAKIEFKNVLQIDPKYADAYYYLGRLEESKKELGRAIGNYNKALELDPNHTESMVRSARIYVLVGTDEYIQKSQELISKIYAQVPGHVGATLIEAAIDAKKGNKSAAIEQLNAIVNKDNSQAEAYSILAGIYKSQNQINKTISTLEEGVKHNPKEVGLRIALAQLAAAESKDFNKAEALLNEVINIEPEVYSHKVMLAGFYASANKTDKAEKIIRQAISEDEDDAQRYLLLVEFLAAKRGISIAEKELLDAIQNKPKLFALRFALSEFYKKLNEYKKSKSVLNDIIALEDISPNGLKARVALANLNLDEGVAEEAHDLIVFVLKENPNDNDALFVSSKISYINKDYISAINSLRTVVKNEPKNVDASLLLAKSHEQNNEPELAKQTLLNILELDPINPRNHLNYANYLATKKEFSKAIEVVDKALDYFKADYELLDARMKLALVTKDENTVKQVLDEMKRVHPNNEGVYIARGQYFESIKQSDKALNEYKQAAMLSNNPYNLLEVIVKIHISNNNLEKAIKDMDEFLADDARKVYAEQILGQIYFSRKDVVKAEKYFLDVIEAAAGWERPYISLASLYISDSRYDKALDVYKRGLSSVTNKQNIQMQMAALYERQNDFDKAINVYNDLLSINPKNLIAANNLASILIDHKANAENVSRALQLTKLFEQSENLAFKDTLGWVYLKSNNVDKAVSLLEEVIAKAPQVGVFQYHLGMAYYQSGDKQNAKKYLDMAVTSGQDYPGKDKAKEILATL